MILIYHSVFPDTCAPERWGMSPVITTNAFKRQILWLADNYHIVSLQKYLAESPKNGSIKPKLIAITFDDGFKATFQFVTPFLVENNIPVTFFVSTGHLEDGELLWFSYLKAICFEKLYQAVYVDRKLFRLQTLKQCRRSWLALVSLAKASGDPGFFSSMLAKTYPISSDVIDLYKGMTHNQLSDASKSDLLDIGAHTISHPFLHHLSREKQEQEVLGSKRILAGVTGKPIHYFAYPGGEYNLEAVETVKAVGYKAAFVVIPKHLGIDRQFEIGRIGIYSPSMFKLKLKMIGVANLARRFRLQVG